MITVRKEWQCPMGKQDRMRELLKEYKQMFDTSPSCRIYSSASGTLLHFVIEDDYESLGDYEVKWGERTSTPEFQTWVAEWRTLMLDGTFQFNFFTNLAE